MENINETEKKLVNASKLKKVLKEVFDVFEENKLSSGEIEFIIFNLQKLENSYSQKEG